MIDVSSKFNTLRYAKARGVLHAAPETIQRVEENTVPKGDVLATARAAGISAAKRCAEWMVFCHSIPLDWVDVSFEVEADQIKVFCEARTVWKTGVEMEAITGVTAALLNMYDMLKPLDDYLSFTDVRVIKKKGGKSDFRDNFDQPLKTAVLVISDSTFAGEREDRSGKIIMEFLQNQPVDIRAYEILPDEQDQIRNRLMTMVDDEGFQLIFTTGGTGPGPRDVTPEATAEVIEKSFPGIAEAMRRHGKERTPYAMLSRELAGLRGNCLIINLPGSSKGALESLQALFPGLLHIYPMMKGMGH
jgi:molybdenum cofactor biosynthesis protein MoaC